VQLDAQRLHRGADLALDESPTPRVVDAGNLRLDLLDPVDRLLGAVGREENEHGRADKGHKREGGPVIGDPGAGTGHGPLLTINMATSTTITTNR
jgi:hypothetical protein